MSQPTQPVAALRRFVYNASVALPVVALAVGCGGDPPKPPPEAAEGAGEIKPPEIDAGDQVGGPIELTPPAGADKPAGDADKP